MIRTKALPLLIAAFLWFLDGCGGGSAPKDSLKFYPLPGSPYGIVDTDLNRDGNRDAAVIIKYSGLFLFFGEGRSLSPEPIIFHFLPYGIAIDTGDFNGDAIPDLAYIVENNVQILVNEGTGRSFDSSLILTGPLFIQSLKTPDLNNDGISDIVAVGAEDRQVYIHLSTSALTYDLLKLDMHADSLYFPFSAKTLSVGDVNGDGLVDILVPEFRNNALWLIWNKGREGFMPQLILTQPADDKILYALLLTFDRKTNTSLIAVITGTYNPKISLLSLSGSMVSIIDTKPLPFPNPIHIYSFERNENSVDIIVTHSRALEHTGGAVSYLRLDKNTGSLSNGKLLHTFPSTGIMSVYAADSEDILTISHNPDRLYFSKIKD